MRFIIDGDPGRFADAVGPFLDARIECNILATILRGVLDGQFTKRAPVLARGIGAGTEIAAVALRTPPWPMVCSELDPVAAPPLMATWLPADPGLNGVNALATTARAISSAWARSTGGSTHCRTRMALHVLRSVTDPPRPGAGELRAASVSHRDLLVAWWRAFAAEAGVFGGGADAEAAVQARLRDHHLWLWHKADGAPVSMVASNPRVGGAVRLGPVYTPPPHRRRGYAGAAVAAVSRRALQDGARECTLFTDVANPTSNKIYAEVGYRRLADWEEHEFSPR
jgi:GNAT superfamily N-acetyltransferase